MRTPELSTASVQEKFWSSIDEDAQETFTEHGDMSSDVRYTPERPSYTPSTIHPEAIAKRLLQYVTGDHS